MGDGAVRGGAHPTARASATARALGPATYHRAVLPLQHFLTFLDAVSPVVGSLYVQTVKNKEEELLAFPFSSLCDLDILLSLRLFWFEANF